MLFYPDVVCRVERRSGLFAIAMGILAVGGSLPPEQAFDQSETIGTARNTPHRIPLRQQDWQLLDSMRSVDAGEPQRSIQAVCTSFSGVCN